MAWFFAFRDGIDLSISLKQRYLAYIALLAGWFIFCYWLYAKEIYPRLHEAKGTLWPVFDENLEYPLAFKWGSDIPYAGKGFEMLMADLESAKGEGDLIVLRGGFFLDEVPGEKAYNLGLRRANRIVEYLDLPQDKVIVESVPGEINADVRSKYFEAVWYERFRNEEVIRPMTDTMEICFPLKNSFALPPILKGQLDNWLEDHAENKEEPTFVAGTADGTGVSESADQAWERALAIKKEMIAHGWSNENIQITTGQRNNDLAIRNRCVIIYFE